MPSDFNYGGLTVQYIIELFMFIATACFIIIASTVTARFLNSGLLLKVLDLIIIYYKSLKVFSPPSV